MQTIRVVVYGTSVMMAVVEAGLRASSQLSVMRIEPTAPHAAGALQHFCPHVVVVDGDQISPAICPTYLVRVDQTANNQAALLDSHTYTIQYLSDLVSLIEACGAGIGPAISLENGDERVAG